MRLHVTDYASWLLIDPSGLAESVFCVRFRSSDILNLKSLQQMQHLSTRTPSLVLQCVHCSCLEISPRGFACEWKCKLWDGGLYVKSLNKKAWE